MLARGCHGLDGSPPAPTVRHGDSRRGHGQGFSRVIFCRSTTTIIILAAARAAKVSQRSRAWEG